MTELPAHPSRLLRFMAGCARWALGLTLAAWLLLAAAWAALQGWIVPRIDSLRPHLEQQATRLLGVPVSIAAISAEGSSLSPSLTLTDLTLQDAQGRHALRLPRVVLALSPRSLLRLGFEQIYIEAPQLQVRRSADGTLWVAGLPLGSSDTQDSRAADWLLTQPEVVIQGGQLHFADEQRSAGPLQLQQVSLVLRNSGWRHALRLDATPEATWGGRFSLRAHMRQPLLSGHAGRWQQWSGQWYAEFSRVDVSRLQQHADLGRLQLTRGAGALRAWGELRRGQWLSTTADLALAELDTRLAPGLQPLALQQLTGRITARQLEGGFEFSTQGLDFRTQDGLRWPGRALLLRQREGSRGLEGELRADQLDLAMLAQIATRLPLGQTLQQALQTYTVAGQVEGLALQWRGPWSAPREYQAQAQARALALGTQAAGASTGLAGLDARIALNQNGGQAQLSMQDGHLLLPSVFAEAQLPLQRLSATLRWQLQGRQIAVQAPDVRFANADAEGQASLAWRTSEATDKSRFPGHLELSGQLQRAKATRVHRYLPLVVPESARHYVRDAVRAGSASRVLFRVKGELLDFPYASGGPGEFHIAAQVRGVDYAYVPTTLQPPDEPPWPALTGLSGELVFDRASMQVRAANGRLAGAPQLQLQRTDARIADLEFPVVEVDGRVAGPLAEMLALVRQSPIASLTQGALDATSASGPAELRLGLTLPIAALAQTSVRGQVQLGGNDVRFIPQAPLVSGARGSVQFSENGFTLAGVQGRALGGNVTLEGGMRTSPQGEPQVRVRAEGQASAQGLRQAGLWDIVSQLASHASGSAAYGLTLGVRQGQAELLVTSDLVGMALEVPAPLGKPAQQPLALRVERRLTPEAAAGRTREDELHIELGQLARLAWVRALDAADNARVLRGAIALGQAAQAPLALPASGVQAHAELDNLDIDAWQALLAPSGGSSSHANNTATLETAQDYLPSSLGLRAARLALGARTLHQVVAGASRQGRQWQLNIDAQELNGHLRYQPGQGNAPGQLHARLARLSLPKAAQEQVDALLSEPAQPQNLPALDIVVQDFELHDRPLGQLEIEARNRQDGSGQRQWQLVHFNLLAPEATLRSSGDWALPAGGGQRRSRLDFALDIRDSGALLARFGMAGVLRQGQGRIDGQLGWAGSPLAPDWRSMNGQLHVEMQAGQFLKADPGLAKLLSVLSLQSLPRRLTLDFRDVFSEGFAFDFVRGDVKIAQGQASTNNLQMKGVNAAVLMEGSADIEQETQNLHVFIVPEINAMTASLVASAIHPVIGLSSFLAQMFLRGPLMEAATQELRIDGTWAEPRVQRVPRQRSAAP